MEARAYSSNSSWVVRTRACTAGVSGRVWPASSTSAIQQGSSWVMAWSTARCWPSTNTRMESPGRLSTCFTSATVPTRHISSNSGSSTSPSRWATRNTR